MRDLRPITPDRVSDLVNQRCGGPAPCTFWQTLPHNGNGAPVDATELLSEWVATVTTDWAPPGRIAYVDDEPVAHVLVAPARHIPRLAAFPTAPADPATPMLLTVSVSPEADLMGSQLRKALFQAAAKDALRLRERAIDVIGVRHLAGLGATPVHPCVLDVDFLGELGFHVKRDHPIYPRLRLDLRTMMSLRDEAAEVVRRALARVPGVAGVRPVPDQPPAAHREVEPIETNVAPGRHGSRPQAAPAKPTEQAPATAPR